MINSLNASFSDVDELFLMTTKFIFIFFAFLKDTFFSIFSDLSYFACNKLFKKDLFESRKFKKGVHFEDIQLIPQLLLQCKVVAQTQNYHYNYLERSDSITKTHTERGLDILKAVKDVEVEFVNSSYSDHKKALQNFQIL